MINPTPHIPSPIGSSSSESESDDEETGDALARRAGGPVVYPTPESVASSGKPEESSGKAERPEDPGFPEGYVLYPPARQKTVEIADESEVEDEVN
jgi:hypothetical protein